MKKIIVIISIIFFIISCSSDKKENPSLSKLKSDKAKLMKSLDSINSIMSEVELAISKLDTTKKIQKVTIHVAKDTLFNHYINLQGMVASDQNVMLQPEMGGTITRIYVREGQRVSAGQTLVQFDDQGIQDRINELKTQLSLATTTYERQQRLWSQKIGSEMQYLQAKSQKDGLEKSLRSLQTQVNKMKLKAPFSGVIDEIFSKNGEVAGMQTPVLRLINLSKMYVEAEVPETYLKSIKKGTKVYLNFVAIGKEMEATISEVGNFINPDNRSFKVRINVQNKDNRLKPNLLADLNINDFSGKGVVLPKQMIQISQSGERFVFSIQKDSTQTTVVKKVLEIENEYNNRVLINSGVLSGEILVNEGGKFLKEGDEVEFNSL